MKKLILLLLCLCLVSNCFAFDYWDCEKIKDKNTYAVAYGVMSGFLIFHSPILSAIFLGITIKQMYDVHVILTEEQESKFKYSED